MNGGGTMAGYQCIQPALDAPLPAAIIGGAPAVSVEVLTPGAAKSWTVTYAYPRQRPCRKSHVESLLGEIDRGTYYPGCLTLADCAETGKTYLIDGQHRLAAAAVSTASTRFTIVRFAYATRHEVDRHYAAIDRGRTRDGRDMPETQELAEREGLNGWQAGQTYAAAALLLTGFQGKGQDWVSLTRSVSLRIEILGKIMNAASRYWRAVSVQGRTEQHLRTSGTVAVGIATFREQPDKARDFWNRVADPEGLTAGTGPYLLMNFWASGRNARLEAHELARYVARAWNMFCEGETRQYLQAQDANRPIRIAGTRYDGKQHVPWFPKTPAPAVNGSRGRKRDEEPVPILSGAR